MTQKDITNILKKLCLKNLSCEKMKMQGLVKLLLTGSSRTKYIKPNPLTKLLLLVLRSQATVLLFGGSIKRILSFKKKFNKKSESWIIQLNKSRITRVLQYFFIRKTVHSIF